MNTPEAKTGQLPAGAAMKLLDLVSYQEGAVVSRTLAKHGGGTVTMFAFDKGQALSEHTAPFDAIVEVAEGHAELVVGGKSISASAGDVVLMPANVPHAVHAEERFKMLLIMIRGSGAS